MKWNEVKRQWPAVQAEVRRTWGRIDEKDLAMIAGNRESFARILAQRYSYEAADAEAKLDAFVDRIDPKRDREVSVRWIADRWRKLRGHIHDSYPR